jgi:predicted tellurium resistance membrane protein TerC
VLEFLLNPHTLIALATLTALEIVLGIDNIIFISILASRLPVAQQARARTLGLAVALISRLGLLFSLAWLSRLTNPLFEVFSHPVSGRDLVLLIGGLFLIGKTTHEIHMRLEGSESTLKERSAPSLWSVVFQIMILDIVFSLDSVITAVGMVDEVSIMATAVVIAVAVMMFAAGTISHFVDRHPTIKMLALSFLLLVGTMLVAEGFGQHVPKGYIYFAMAFSVLVETLNLKAGRGEVPVQLREGMPRVNVPSHENERSSV